MSTIEWINTGGGDWGVSGNWSGNSVPGGADDATISVAGPYTVTINSPEAAHSLTLGNAGATVQLNDALVLGGTLGLTAGVFDLNPAGTLAGGTVIGSGMVFQGGTLSTATRQGTLDLSASSARVHVANGITLTGAGGSGSGSVALTGYKAGLYFAGTQSLDNAAVSIGNKYNYVLLSQSGGGRLTLGANLALTQTAKYAELYIATGSAITNAGTITAATNGGRFLIAGGGSFTNQGTIGIASGATLRLNNNLATAALGSVSNSGTLVIGGVLNNTGAVLATGAGGLGTVALSGTVSGGTVTGSGMQFQHGDLSGVTYRGTLDLSQNGAVLGIDNGITLTGAGGSGPGTVLLTGSGSNLTFNGTQTFDNAAVSLSGTLAQKGSSGILTLGPNLALTQTGQSAQISPDYFSSTVLNRGTITAAVNGGRLSIYPSHFGGFASFTNYGTIGIANGDNVVLTNRITTGSPAFVTYRQMSFTNRGIVTLDSGGVLTLGAAEPGDLAGVTNSGGTLALAGAFNNKFNVLQTGTASALGTVALSGGKITGGTVAGAGVLIQSGTLSGVVYQSPLDLSSVNSTATIANGITLTGSAGSGPGFVQLTGNGSRLTFLGTQTVDNATICIGGSSTYSYLGAYRSSPGQMGTLTLGPGVTVTQVGRYAALKGKYGFSSYTYNAPIINQGTINAGASGGRLRIGRGTFGNQGVVNISNGETVTVGSRSGFGAAVNAATITGTGTISLASGGVLSLTGAIQAGQTVDFLDGTGRLTLGEIGGGGISPSPFPSTFSGSIIDFQIGDSIDFQSIGLATAYTYSGGMLSLQDGTGRQLTQVSLLSTVANPIFALASNGATGNARGTLVTEFAPYTIDAPLMTNTITQFDYDTVVNGQMVYTHIGGLGPEWEIDGAGTGLLNGDGMPAFLIRNTGNVAPGRLNIGEVNGSAVFTTIGGIGPEWQLAGNGAFLGHGQADFLMRNTGAFANGALDVGEVTNGSATFTQIGAIGPEWEFGGTGDFLGDGHTGFLIRNTGNVANGLLDVGEVVNGSVVLTPIGGIGPEWQFKGVGDFLGNGHTAFLIRNNGAVAPGLLGVGEVVNGGFTFTEIGTVGPEWEFVGTGHYLSSTHSDFLMRNTGNVAPGILDVGAIVNGTANFTTVGAVGPEWNFHSTNVAVLPHF